MTGVQTCALPIYTWDATALTAFKGLNALGRGLNGYAAEDVLLKGVTVSGKIGHHEPCALRVYQHPDIMALSVGLATKTAMQEITATPVPAGTVRVQVTNTTVPARTVRVQVTNTTVPARTVRVQEITAIPVRFRRLQEQPTPGAGGK